MTIFDAFAVTAAVTAIVPILKEIIELLRFRRHKKSMEVSLRLHEYVLKNKTRLTALEVRDGNIRKVLLTSSDLHMPDNVRKAYEMLLEQDLSKEYESISKQSHHHQLYLGRYLNAISGDKEPSLVTWTNSGLIRAALSSKLSATGKLAEERSSILELMVGQRMKIYGKAYAFLYSTLAIGLATYTLVPSEIATLASVALPSLLIIALFSNQKLLEFRVSRGLFGNNSSEALEFIRFIKAHSDKSDFSDGDKMRKLLPDAETLPIEERIVFGRGATA